MISIDKQNKDDFSLFFQQRVEISPFKTRLPVGIYRFLVVETNPEGYMVSTSSFEYIKVSLPDKVEKYTPETPAIVENEADEQMNAFIAVGLGPEANFFVTKGYAGGLSVYGEYTFNGFISAGVRIAGFYNFFALNNQDIDQEFSEEIGIFTRWYFFNKPKMRLFAELALGLAFMETQGRMIPFALAKLSAGARFFLGDWFVEPFISGDYPAMGSVGVLGGYQFRARGKVKK
jgi:hypothetical protein